MFNKVPRFLCFLWLKDHSLKGNRLGKLKWKIALCKYHLCDLLSVGFLICKLVYNFRELNKIICVKY